MSWRKKRCVRVFLPFFTVIRCCLFSANTHLFSCLLLWELNGAWRPNEIGRKEIRAEVTHITKIEMGTDFRVSHSVYCNGSLMWMYLKIQKYVLCKYPQWSLQKKVYLVDAIKKLIKRHYALGKKISQAFFLFTFPYIHLLRIGLLSNGP